MAARSGEQHHMARFTDREAELIRRLRDLGLRYKTIAHGWNVSVSCICGVCTYRRRAGPSGVHKM